MMMFDTQVSFVDLKGKFAVFEIVEFMYFYEFYAWIQKVDLLLIVS